jgi:hypothetical protein
MVKGLKIFTKSRNTANMGPSSEKENQVFAKTVLFLLSYWARDARYWVQFSATSHLAVVLHLFVCFTGCV